MHPRDALGFEFDEDHLAAHGIATWEVEEVFYNGPRWASHAGHDVGHWKMRGVTDAGRCLIIVVAVKSDLQIIRAFTGWDCP